LEDLIICFIVGFTVFLVIFAPAQPLLRPALQGAIITVLNNGIRIFL
jgi:hypothetical protein